MRYTNFNLADYSTVSLALAKGAANADAKANAFVPFALAALLSGEKSMDDILLDLCGRKDDESRKDTLFRSAKGKANAHCLPAASAKAFRQCKTVWEYCLKTNEQGEVSRELVKAFCLYMTDGDVETMMLDYEAHCDAKGIDGNAPGNLARFETAYMANKYPSRPANFNQLVRAIKAANGNGDEQDVSPPAAESQSSGENDGEGEGESQSRTMASILADATALLNGMTGEEVQANWQAIEDLLAAIAPAFDRATATATPEAIAA